MGLAAAFWIPASAGITEFAVDHLGEGFNHLGHEAGGLDTHQLDASFLGLLLGGDVDVVEDFKVVGEELDGDDEGFAVA